MIKLKPLLERISTKPFSDKLGRNHLVNHYEDAFEQWMSENILYRGHSTGNSYEEVYPSKGERISTDTSNIYTVLLSRLPSWKGWPQRSNSLIFSNSQAVSSEYGSKMFYVFPNKNAKIVITPSSDIFERHSFPFLFKYTKLNIQDLGILSSIIESLDDRFPDVEWEDIGYSDNTDFLKADEYNHFIKHLQSVSTRDKVIKLYKNVKKSKISRRLYGEEDKTSKILNGYINTYKTHNGNWEMFLDFLLNPESNGFKLVPFLKLNKSSYIGSKENEMWTDSNCMLVDIRETEILEKLGKAVFA